MAEKVGVFREWSKRYLLEYLAALVLCLISAGFCIPLARSATRQAMRILFMMGPTAALLLMALVVLRHFLRVDEFLRRVMMESFALTGAFTFLWTLAYALFELAGFPRISMWWVWASMTLVLNLWIWGRWALRR